MKHNNQICNIHRKKSWAPAVGRVRTWLDQAGRKSRRRTNRAVKAAKISPRPVAGLLRPEVRGQTFKYHTKTKSGKGFTLEELKAAGVPRKMALTIGISVDHRRKNRCEESLNLNVLRLKEYMSKLVLFPRNMNKPKAGDASAADCAAASQLTTKAVLPLAKKDTSVEVRAITEEEKKFNAFITLRMERANARMAGRRIQRRADRKAAEEEKRK